MARINQKNRRGLSSVIGAVFMVLIMIGALNVVLLTMRQQDTVTQAVIDKSSSSINRLNEQISISDIGVTNNNKLNMTVSNSGGTAAKLASLYIVNETAPTKQQYRYNLSSSVDGRNAVKSIGNDLAFTAKSDTNYSIKIVTQAGNFAVTNIGSLSKTAMGLSMFVIPPTIAPGANVTILMAVTNNNTNVNIPYSVSAKMTYSTNCTPTVLYSCSIQLMKTEGNGTKISRGSVVFYKWVYKITAPDNTSYTFTGSLVNGKPGNSGTVTVTVKLLDSGRSTTSAGSDFLSLKFLNNVGISLITPGPFGTAGGGNYGVWGLIVSNPTSQSFSVSRVAISLISPANIASDDMIPSGCAVPNNIQPGNGTWSCAASNTLQWKGTAGSITVPAYSSRAFIANVTTGSLNSGEIPAAIVSGTAFTTYGEFSKSGYATNLAKTVAGSGSAIANVFFSTKSTNSTLGTDMLGYLEGVKSGSIRKFNITLTDYEKTAGVKINSGAQVIVNLPPDWVVQNFTSYGGFSRPQLLNFTDHSSVIKATRTSDITGTGSSKAGTIGFNILVPTITDTRIYIITVTTDGQINLPAGFNLGAIQEFPIQVIP